VNWKIPSSEKKKRKQSKLDSFSVVSGKRMCVSQLIIKICPLTYIPYYILSFNIRLIPLIR